MIDKILKLLKIKFAGELMLKDGTPIIVDGDLAVGIKVSVNGPDGIIPLPAGSYELENGTIITVDDKGVITDIVEQVETPETPDEEPVVEEMKDENSEKVEEEFADGFEPNTKMKIGEIKFVLKDKKNNWVKDDFTKIISKYQNKEIPVTSTSGGAVSADITNFVNKIFNEISSSYGKPIYMGSFRVYFTYKGKQGYYDSTQGLKLAEVTPVEPTEPTVTEVPEEDMMKKIEEMMTKISELESKIATIEEKTSTMSQESINFSQEIKNIKEKANFVKELPKNSLPDTPVVSNPKAALVERIKQLKNK